MPRLLLYPFRYLDPVSAKWIQARYVCELREIETRHAHGEWEITGPPEIRDIDPRARYFHPGPASGPGKPVKGPPQPKKPPAKEPPPKDPPVKEPAVQVLALGEQPPAIDALERFLVLIFLRRYVTHCARRRHYGQMQSAAALHSEIVEPRHESRQ